MMHGTAGMMDGGMMGMMGPNMMQAGWFNFGVGTLFFTGLTILVWLAVIKLWRELFRNKK